MVVRTWKNMVCTDKNSDHGHNHGCTFTDNKPHYGEADGGRHIVLFTDIVNHVDASYTEDLFRQLGEGRDCGLADTIEIAVDAGVYCRHGNREGYNTQQWSRSWFQKEGCANPVRIGIDIQGTGSRKGHCKEESCPQRAKRRFIIPRGCFAGHILGDSGLYAGYGQGERERQNRGDKLIDSHTFGAEHVGEKDAVEEADETAEQSCQGKNDSSGY